MAGTLGSYGVTIDHVEQNRMQAVGVRGLERGEKRRGGGPASLPLGH